MKTAEEYLRSHPFILGETEDGEDYLSTDDIELIKQLAPMFEEYAESYHKERVNRVTELDIVFAINEWVNEEPARGYCRYGFDSGAKWLKSKLMEE